MPRPYNRPFWLPSLNSGRGRGWGLKQRTPQIASAQSHTTDAMNGVPTRFAKGNYVREYSPLRGV